MASLAAQAKALLAARPGDEAGYEEVVAWENSVLAVTDPARIEKLKDLMDAEWEKVHHVRETHSDAQLAVLLAEHPGIEGVLREARRVTRLLADCGY